MRIGAAAAALGVSVDTLRRWEANGIVEFERRGNQRVLRVDKLAALTASASGADKTSSARNRLSGIVVGITKDRVMAQVEMMCGEFRVVSLMSREAADELGLEIGKHATAVIKSTNVIVEV